MSADDNPDQNVGISEVSFEESENYVQRRRQKEILDAAKDALDTRRAAREELARGEIDAETCREVLRISVENLIAEIEHMVQRVGDVKVWKQTQLGEPVRVYPPAELIQYLQSDNVDPIGDVNLQPKTVARIRGLKGYRDSDTVFTAKWSVSLETRHHGPQQDEFVSKTQMPIGISEAAISGVKGFLSRCSLGIDARLDDYTGDDGPGL